MSPPLQMETYTAPTTTTTMPTFLSTPVIKTTAAEMMPSLAKEVTRELNSSHQQSPQEQMETVSRYHNHEVGPNQCCSGAVKRIAAPVQTVWNLVRRFDQPQTYKHLLRSCRMITGDGGQVGSLREVHCVSGIPASSSTEQLTVLDEESHVIGFRIVSGKHRLQNYRSVTTVHPTCSPGGDEGTVVVESYVVDVPQGNTKQDTYVFVDTIVRCNLQTLSNIAERIATSSESSTGSTSSTCTVLSSSSCKVS